MTLNFLIYNHPPLFTSPSGDIHLVSSFLSVEFRPSTFRKASSLVLSAWPARYCNSSNVIPARAISAGPSWYNWTENAMHIIPAIKTIQSCKTSYSLYRPSLQAWGTNGLRKKTNEKKMSRKEPVTGFTQIFGFKIQDFFQNFFQNNNFFLQSQGYQTGDQQRP